MLFERDVVNAVCRIIEQNNFIIEHCSPTDQHGYDIISSKEKDSTIIKLYIEAKGETSSRVGSAKYGYPFDGAQVRVHIAEALYKSAEALCIEENEVKIFAGIALPDNISHRSILNKIKPFILGLNIILFWVKEDRSVEIESTIFESL